MKSCCMTSVSYKPVLKHVLFYPSIAVLLMNSSSSTRAGGFSGWQQASLEFSHSRAIRVLQLNSCTTVEKTAIVSGSEQKWESSNILCRAKTTAMARCELAQVIFFFSWPCLPFVLRESCPKWLCLLWMIFSTKFEIKGGLITDIVFVV